MHASCKLMASYTIRTQGMFSPVELLDEKKMKCMGHMDMCRGPCKRRIRWHAPHVSFLDQYTHLPQIGGTRTYAYDRWFTLDSYSRNVGIFTVGAAGVRASL